MDFMGQPTKNGDNDGFFCCLKDKVGVRGIWDVKPLDLSFKVCKVWSVFALNVEAEKCGLKGVMSHEFQVFK